MLKSSGLKTIGKAAFAAIIAAVALMATPAQARHRDRGGDDAAIAIGAGIIGLAIGAAIASDHGDDYYDRRNYRRGYYPRHSGYYYDGYPRTRHYRGHYRDRRDYRRDRHYRKDRRRYHSDRGHYRSRNRSERRHYRGERRGHRNYHRR